MAAAFAGFEITHGFQQPLMILKTPHQNTMKPGWSHPVIRGLLVCVSVGIATARQACQIS